MAANVLTRECKGNGEREITTEYKKEERVPFFTRHTDALAKTSEFC